MRTILTSPVLLAAALAAGAPLKVPHPDLPAAVLPEGVGVNIHFTRGHERDLDLIAAAGFKFIRMDFSWSGTERQKGEYRWGDYEELTANLEKRGLRALYILDYSNGLYEDTIVSRDPISGKETRAVAAPRKPESRAAFARWAAAAARHFQGRRILWEIWNEPNIGFWRPEPNVQDYAQLVLATCGAVRAADPNAAILAPASSGFPWKFFEDLFRAGVLEHLDAVSVHPYRSYSQGPETALKDYRRLRALIERYAPPAKKFLPILSGEWGYATHAKGGVSLETQAAFIARQQLANLYAGVPLSIWYDWKNDGTDPNYHEHNFGTVSNNLALKPSYLAVQTLTREMAGYRLARRLEVGHPDAWVLLCVNARADQKLAAWTAGQAHEVILDLKLGPAESVSGVDGLGRALALKVSDGKLTLALQALPQYVTFKERVPGLSAAAAWQLGPVPSLVEAGRPDALAVPLTVRNPFPQPLRASVSLQGVEVPGDIRHAWQLRAGEVREHTFFAGIHQRWPDTLSARLQVALAQEAGPDSLQPLGMWQEELPLTVANPLELQLAPVEGGLRLDLASPAGGVFTGLARLGHREQPVRLTPQQPAARLRFEDPTARAAMALQDDRGRLVAQMPAQEYRPILVERLRAVLDGDAKVPAQASLVLTNAPDEADRPFAQAWRLDYDFEAGWRFVRVVVESPRPERLAVRPTALGLWVHGDGSGNALRARLTDEQQQTFQPSGPDLAWRGWRWVTFNLADLRQAGHWGGPDDGVVRGRLRLDTLMLVDGSRKKTAGTVWLAGPVLVYGEVRE